MDGVVGVPAGCTLYRVSAFQRMPYSKDRPWFKTTKGTLDDGEGAVPTLGTEDLYYCQRLEKELHGKILMDTGILCDHIDHSTGVRFTLPDDCLPRRRARDAAGNKKTILHVGCGPRTAGVLPREFAEWKEVRLDIDRDVGPDIVASIADMRAVADSSVDAVWSSHNLEHLAANQVPLALSEFRRVTKPGCAVYIIVPDIGAVAAEIARGGLDSVLYVSPAGPITPLDVLYGHAGMIAQGNDFQCHKTGFTGESIERQLTEAGFSKVIIQKNTEAWGLCATAVV
jgi:hypothetical protein